MVAAAAEGRDMEGRDVGACWKGAASSGEQAPLPASSQYPLPLGKAGSKAAATFLPLVVGCFPCLHLELAGVARVVCAVLVKKGKTEPPEL